MVAAVVVIEEVARFTGVGQVPLHGRVVNTADGENALVPPVPELAHTDCTRHSITEAQFCPVTVYVVS
jgi:hypothetical protein